MSVYLRCLVAHVCVFVVSTGSDISRPEYPILVIDNVRRFQVPNFYSPTQSSLSSD